MKSWSLSVHPLSILLAICSQGFASLTTGLYDTSQENKVLYKRDEETDQVTPRSSTTETSSLKKFFDEVKGHDITIGSITIAPLYLAAFICGVVLLALLCAVICCLRARRAKKRKMEKEKNNSCYMFEDIPSTRSNPPRGKLLEMPRSEFGELLDGEEGYSLSPPRNNSSTMNLLNSSTDSDFSETSSHYSGVRGKQSKEAAWRLGDLKLGSPHQSPPRRYLRDSYRVW